MRQKPISELRCRMLEDMSVRKFSEATCRNYIRHIAEFAKFLGRSPDTATADLRQFGPHAGALPTRRQHACDRLALACEDMRWANPFAVPPPPFGDPIEHHQPLVAWRDRQQTPGRAALLHRRNQPADVN